MAYYYLSVTSTIYVLTLIFCLPCGILGMRLVPLGKQLSVFHITNLGAGNSQSAKSWLNLTDFLSNVSLGTLHILWYPFYDTQIFLLLELNKNASEF